MLWDINEWREIEKLKMKERRKKRRRKKMMMMMNAAIRLIFAFEIRKYWFCLCRARLISEFFPSRSFSFGSFAFCWYCYYERAVALGILHAPIYLLAFRFRRCPIPSSSLALALLIFRMQYKDSIHYWSASNKTLYNMQKMMAMMKCWKKYWKSNHFHMVNKATHKHFLGKNDFNFSHR